MALKQAQHILNTKKRKKLDGGIQLNSYFSVQNCEDGNSSFSCGESSGAMIVIIYM